MNKATPLTKFYLRLDDDFNWVPVSYAPNRLIEILGNSPVHTIVVRQFVRKDHVIHLIYQTTVKGDKHATHTGDFPNDVKTLSHDRLGGILGIPTDEVEQELKRLFKAFALII